MRDTTLDPVFRVETRKRDSPIGESENDKVGCYVFLVRSEKNQSSPMSFFVTVEV
jgi:hypothetical protein